MQISGSFNTCPPDYEEHGFSGLETGSYGMRSSISDSPIRSFAFLPGGDPSSGRQSFSGINTTFQGGFTPTYPAPNDLPSSTLDQFNAHVQQYLQDSGTTLSDTRTSHYPSTAFGSMVHDLRESLPSVAHAPSTTPYPVHNGPPNRAFSHHGGNLSIREPHLAHPAIYPHCLQINPTPNVAAQEYPVVPSPAIPATVPLSSMARGPIRRNSREARSTPSSPYRQTRSPLTPFQSVSPNDTRFYACGWITDDGGFCMESISRSTISDHFITHGITNLGHENLISCKWAGCRLRGGKEYMKRESIVRHIREKHLRCRRSSN